MYKLHIHYFTAICGPPSPPLNGYIYSYSNKSLRVIVVCHEGYASYEERLHIADCHPNGTWQPNPSDLCDSEDESQTNPGKSIIIIVFDMTAWAPSLLVLPEIKHITNCNCNVFTTIIISSVSSSFFFFVVGLICGLITSLSLRLIWKKTKPQPHSESSPDYEVVPPINLPSSQKTHREVNLQLNEAYGPLWI